MLGAGDIGLVRLVGVLVGLVGVLIGLVGVLVASSSASSASSSVFISVLVRLISVAAEDEVMDEAGDRLTAVAGLVGRIGAECRRDGQRDAGVPLRSTRAMWNGTYA